MTATSLDRDAVLRLVRQWPVSEQVALADAILADVRASTQPVLQPPAIPTAALRGILSNGQPAPSDEEVARILDEERMKRYGG